ncbi:MAG TPA: ZIP family metal transporter [Blastocatellia bacterium]|nr:ZIP family metal transporter [Blastocatellia bacterium]
MTPFIQLTLSGLLAASANLLGGFLVTRTKHSSHHRLKYLVALGAGFMLAAVIIEVIPATTQMWGLRSVEAMTWLLAGYLLIQFAEHTLAPHFHFGEETHAEEVLRQGAATTAVVALSIHTFFDGVTIASGSLTSLRLGVLLFIAVMLHKIPEGFTIASIMLASGHSRRGALQATAVIALATVAGVLLVGVLSVTTFHTAVRYALPVSAGVTLYVAASDLIPEVNREGGARTSLMVFAGVALFYLTHLLLHEAFE